MYLDTLDKALTFCRIPKERIGGGWHYIPKVYILAAGITSAPKFHCHHGNEPFLRYVLRDLEYSYVSPFAAWIEVDRAFLTLNSEDYRNFRLVFSREDRDPYNDCHYEYETNYDKAGNLLVDKGIRSGGKDHVFHHRICIGTYLFTRKQECIDYGFEHGHFDVEKVINAYKLSIETLEIVGKAMENYNANYRDSV